MKCRRSLTFRTCLIKRRHWLRLAGSLGLGADEAYERLRALSARLPDALADASGESNLTADEQRIADAIRDQISGWALARAEDLA